MSRKVAEDCPRCGEQVEPVDHIVKTKDIGWRPWVYRCRCGWIWANDAQRKHNEQARYRAERDWRLNG